MRLKKLTVSRYRSVQQAEELVVDSGVTILIGANDHGKSNLLSALLCLNDNKPIAEEDKNWDADADFGVELKWIFICDEKDLAALTKLVRTPVDPSVQEGGQQEAVAIVTPETFQITRDLQLVYSRNSKSNILKVDAVPIPGIPVSAEQQILDLRPRVEYFESPTTNLRDQVNLSELESPEFEFMQGIFRLAGLWGIRETIFTQNDRTSRALDEASARLTKVLNDQWNQGKELKWKLEHTGTNGDHIVIKIQDPAIRGRYTRPSLRSSGFRTYFLLSMIIYARTQNQRGNTFIYLFDEPGTYLHPHAQLDLQRSFETIADNAQVIYTTHSLFLVNKNHPERNRVVTKTRHGTKIDQKPFTKNWKAVRDSLGILLSNNFLIAEKTLLVEGPSDLIYLLDAIKKLKGAGSIDIDLNDFSVVDAGDSQNYVAMAKLLLSEGRDIVALLDGNGSGRNVESQLKRSCASEIREKKLHILRLPENKSSEDVFVNVEALRQAVHRACDSLVADGIRTTKAGLNLDTELQRLSGTVERTLGKTLDDITASFFDPELKISKLLVALMYEDVREQDQQALPTDALEHLESIKTSLGLRGERSVDAGVFEEVR